MQNTIKLDEYRNKLKAALFGRFAGCTLGAPVEGWSLEKMENYAKELGITEYPLTDYWPSHPNPEVSRYQYEKLKNYTKDFMDHVPCDDDIGYTYLSLFIAEEGNGLDFTLNDVANAWLKYLPFACTAEQVALGNLQKGIPPSQAAEFDNPYQEWIGADIRCDGYGYMAPCNPKKAAEMAKTDAWISHRNNGVYGLMYFAAVISLCFCLSDPKKALVEGLNYISADCELADAVRWALEHYDAVKDYRHAAELVDEKFPGMHIVHTINNACLIIFALALGGKDVGKVIANAVAMAHDNDCTAATAGSIAGACYGMDSLDAHWYLPFNDKVSSYFNGPRYYSISDLLARFEKMALKSGSVIP